jgi:hypothetical protein
LCETIDADIALIGLTEENVVICSQLKGLIDRSIFWAWFEDVFIPRSVSCAHVIKMVEMLSPSWTMALPIRSRTSNRYALGTELSYVFFRRETASWDKVEITVCQDAQEAGVRRTADEGRELEQRDSEMDASLPAQSRCASALAYIDAGGKMTEKTEMGATMASEMREKAGETGMSDACSFCHSELAVEVLPGTSDRGATA